MVEAENESDFIRPTDGVSIVRSVGTILGSKIIPSGVSPNQRSLWKDAFSLLSMFNLRLYNTATIQYSLTKFGHIHRCDIDYIAYQLCGITILVPPVCFTAGGNLCQCQYKASNYIWRTSRDPLTNLYGRPSLLSCPNPPSFLGVVISHLSQWQCGTKVAVMPTNIQPLTIVFSVLGLSRREMSRITGVAHDAIFKVLYHACESSSLCQYLLKTITSKEDHALLRIMRQTVGFFNIQDQGGADQMDWTLCLCPHGAKMFNRIWILLKTSRAVTQTDSWPSPPILHVVTQSPELEPSSRVPCAFCWWFHSQPPQL